MDGNRLGLFEPMHDVLSDVDLGSDEAWAPTWSPYHACLVPAWVITQEARLRLGWWPALVVGKIAIRCE